MAPKPRATRLPARKWMLLAVISDSPKAGEEYLTEADIRDLALTNDLIEGMKFSKIKLTPLPPRRKTDQKWPEGGPKMPISGRKTLDTPPPSTK